MVSKEQLVGLLKDAVIEAHIQNPYAVGVVLFGSRARDNAGEDSDVDLLPIAENNIALCALGAFNCLYTSITPRLERLNLEADMLNGSLVVSMLEGSLAGTAGPSEVAYLESVCSLFDEQSIVLAVPSRDLPEKVLKYCRTLKNWLVKPPGPYKKYPIFGFHERSLDNNGR